MPQFLYVVFSISVVVHSEDRFFAPYLKGMQKTANFCGETAKCGLRQLSLCHILLVVVTEWRMYL